ncbi:hypothetical protein Acsp02_41260 [Actinoplanes sp. NBRC 103695]|nr:hypothetical protein Acsp02_41260 [Actinoplanes sp. NBRC 103695]
MSLTVLAGCTDSPAPPPAPPSAAPSGATSPAPVQVREVDAAGDRLTMTVQPLARRDETVVLTIATRLDAAHDGVRSARITDPFSTLTSSAFDTVRLVDPAGRRVWTIAPGADGKGCMCTGPLRADVGETRSLQAVFTGVPAGVTRLAVMLPYAGVFPDVPVVPGDLPGPLDVTGAGASYSASLDAWTERLDAPITTRRTPSQVDINLDADVLFRVDEATLTPAGTRAVRAMVTDLQAAGPAALTITGHTDNTGATAHNQELSEQRARTVARAMTGSLPPKSWPQTVAGRGEQEPAASNKEADGRRRNRRVTVSYRLATPAAAPSALAPSAPAPSAPAGARAVPLPKTKGTVGTATAGAEVALPLNRGTLRLTAAPARTVGPFLQVDLLATNIGDDDATIHDYLGQGVFTVRDEFDPFARFGASGVRTLAGGSVGYNLDYVIAGGGHRCLCDRVLNQRIPPGSTRTIALWFPAPPPGTTEIALDVPDNFRLTGIPIS